jgi:hypothetical protein
MLYRVRRNSFLKRKASPPYAEVPSVETRVTDSLTT